jgi:hypothetical protein
MLTWSPSAEHQFGGHILRLIIGGQCAGVARAVPGGQVLPAWWTYLFSAHSMADRQATILCIRILLYGQWIDFAAVILRIVGTTGACAQCNIWTYLEPCLSSPTLFGLLVLWVMYRYNYEAAAQWMLALCGTRSGIRCGGSARLRSCRAIDITRQYQGCPMLRHWGQGTIADLRRCGCMRGPAPWSLTGVLSHLFIFYE